MQEAFFEALFAAGALRHKPPPRYEFRVLKELLSRIEASIDDWEQHVSAPLHGDHSFDVSILEVTWC